MPIVPQTTGVRGKKRRAPEGAAPAAASAAAPSAAPSPPKPHACTWPGCFKSFLKPCHQARHMLTHDLDLVGPRPVGGRRQVERAVLSAGHHVAVNAERRPCRCSTKICAERPHVVRMLSGSMKPVGVEIWTSRSIPPPQPNTRVALDHSAPISHLALRSHSDRSRTRTRSLGSRILVLRAAAEDLPVRAARGVAWGSVRSWLVICLVASALFF